MSSNYSDAEINQLVSGLKQIPPIIVNDRTNLTGNNPALKVIDCVFSLGRTYDTQVIPLINNFLNEFPQINTLEGLMDKIDECGDCKVFFSNLLNYRDDDKSETCYWVLYYFIEISKQYSGSQIERLHTWAISVKPDAYRRMIKYKGFDRHIRGFGPAGWQYMRMLFGADTCKPDRHIINFIQNTTGRKVSPICAVEMLELAAPKAGLKVREADRRIWHKYSEDSKSKRKYTPKQCL